LWIRRPPVDSRGCSATCARQGQLAAALEVPPDEEELDDDDVLEPELEDDEEDDDSDVELLLDDDPLPADARLSVR